MNTIESSDRVVRHSPEKFNLQIEEQTIRRLNATGNDKEKIQKRLQELNKEWDIERAIETNASTILLTSLLLGATVNRKWFLLSGTVAGFLLQHSVQGWCPPVPVLRSLGFRTQKEIDNERIILLSRIKGLPDINTDSQTAMTLLKN